MAWSDNPEFAAGQRGNIGALARSEWAEGGASLWQWRGLLASCQRVAPLLKAMKRLGAPPPFGAPWFEHDRALCAALRRIGIDGGGVVEWVLRHPQTQAYARSVMKAPYPDWEGTSAPERTCQPMMWAVSTSSLPSLKVLLALAPPEEWTCLTAHRTARGAGYEVGPLPHAVRRGWLEGVRLLIDAGATSEDGVLAMAGQSRQLDVVRFLLEEGADVHQRDAKGQTVLGRIARHIRQAPDPSPEALSEWLEVARLIAVKGGRFDVHDGLTARADTVESLWLKALGPENASPLQAVLAAQALEKELNRGLPSPVERPRRRF